MCVFCSVSITNLKYFEFCSTTNITKHLYTTFAGSYSIVHCVRVNINLRSFEARA